MSDEKLKTETRECGGCKHYKTDPTSVSGRLGICKKHLMAVTMTMLVTYHETKGTCFEPIELKNQPA